MDHKDKKSVARVSRSSFRKAENPEPVEKISKGIIRWGANNLYPQELVAYRQDNPIHGGIIEQKVTYITAGGADISGAEWLDEKMREKIQEILVPVSDDFETFNGFAVLFVRSGERWNVEHIDFESVRYLEEEGFFGISDDWSSSKQTLEKTNYREVKDLSRGVLSGPDADNELLLYCKIKPKQRKLKNGKLSLCYYPVPVYIGGLISILAGIEQDYFTYSEAVNGYKGGTMVSLNNGQPDTDEEADRIADKIKDEATDRDTQGGLLVNFADGAENAPTVLQLNGNDLDKRYIESNKEIKSKIMVGHSVGSSTLFAVNNESAFGSKEEMETAYTLFVNNYVRKRQKFMADSLHWAFARLGMKDLAIQYKRYELFPTPAPVQQEKMNAKDPILVRMSKLGVSRKDREILKSRTFDFESSDEDFLKSVEKFNSLTAEQKLILKLINDGKTFSEVSRAVGKGALYLSLQIVKLNSIGALSGWKVTDPGSIDLEVRYSYEVKAGLGPTLIATSREFCRDMVELDRLYTRAEIDRLSNEMDTDVWRYRGGWYTNPQTGKSTPSCRHEWRQNVVRR